MHKDVLDDECISCGEEMPEAECSKSKRKCGHHCNCSWMHDVCHWCGEQFGGITLDPSSEYTK